jgi:hypothetical protein
MRLASIGFAIAPGYSTAISAVLSPQNLTPLAHLDNRPLDVTLTGRGFWTASQQHGPAAL